jgi:hypothetical protein
MIRCFQGYTLTVPRYRVVGHFIRNVILPLLVLSAIYTTVIIGLVLLLRKMGVSERRTIILSFLVFGAVTGMLTARIWPIESSIYFNVFASLLGDEVYILSIRYIGDMNSPHAHYTIPWILRIPQVYVIASLVLSASIGLPLQWVCNKRLEAKRRS